jgi:ABC-type lipoprotein release transport system permease subunit
VICFVNNFTAHTTLLSKLASPGETYLVTSKNSTSLSDSQIDPAIVNQIRNNSNIKDATSQQIIQAILTTNGTSYTVTARGVDDLQVFLRNHQASLSGSISQTESQTNMGIILSKITSINKNDQFNITVRNRSAQLYVAGITQAAQQSDSELTMPLTTLQSIIQENSTVSFIEFSVKDQTIANKTIADLTQILPPNTKITSTQQVTVFAQDINNQTVVFINVWSIAIYVVVVAASYVIASRAVNEAEYELYMFKTLGAKKKSTFTLILVYSLTLAFIGSVIGVSIGIVGTQGASTLVRLVWGNSLLAPFLNVNQALEILLLALASAFIGSLYPAIRGSQNNAGANPQ